MHIVKMELAGRITKGSLPEYFATIHRVPGNDYITVTIISPDGQREHLVEANNPEDAFSMAECLQYHLEGNKGTNSDVHGYYKLLQMFMD
jgi:hypothetical protein